jgi:hypothetical protein
MTSIRNEIAPRAGYAPNRCAAVVVDTNRYRLEACCGAEV